MPTAVSWADRVSEARLAAADVGHLLRLRRAIAQREGVGRRLAGVFWLTTAVVAVVPAFVVGAGSADGRPRDVLGLLPAAFLAVLVTTAVAAVASGGGRELLPRDEGAVHPISPTTDHLGALVLAPLNTAWLIQAWALLGGTAYVVGPDDLVPAQVGVVLWLAAATAVAQAVAWSVEAVRRRERGALWVRGTVVGLVTVAVVVQLTGRLVPVLDGVSPSWVVAGLVAGWGSSWFVVVAVEILALAVAVVLGAVPAHLAARRLPRDEMRVASGARTPRRDRRSDFGAMVRVDRASVWRAVPMRRGLVVLAGASGLVALAGGLGWAELVLLPGLVASGGALLFGVNAWCVDGRGALWRESLPVRPDLVFGARMWVLGEFLVVAALMTLALGGLRAGVPAPHEAAALLSATTVTLLQVVAASARWSLRHPYAVDLGSARATPAPPLWMVRYSVRLALTVTLTGLLFSLVARLPFALLPVVVALPFLVWSVVRLARARTEWLDPAARARVVTTVAG